MKIQKWIIPGVGICFGIIIALMTTDFIAKHVLYLQQRDILYEYIREGIQHEELKKTVSYLQGTATRRLNQIKEIAIYFGLSFLVFIFFMKGEEK